MVKKHLKGNQNYMPKILFFSGTEHDFHFKNLLHVSQVILLVKFNFF